MPKEYVIWGIPPEGTEEAVLYTLAETLEEADRVMGILVSDHGITRAHVQVIDFNQSLANMWMDGGITNA